MWHGGGQFSKTWETTPDGRAGARGHHHKSMSDLNNVEVAELLSRYLREKRLDQR
jgi:hypothetical protein